ncbi:MAG: DNA recombination protein RmuC [Gammaproteobacteria bacterium]|nr:DNA recombination protein RmuC [Gammaproteobacteria bacterium]
MALFLAAGLVFGFALAAWVFAARRRAALDLQAAAQALELERLGQGEAQARREAERLAEQARQQQGELAAARQEAQRLAAERAGYAAEARRVPELEREREALNGLAQERAAQVRELETRIAEERLRAEEKLALLLDAKQQLAQDFESLARRIFEEKSEKFSAQSKEQLGALLNPLREQLGEFRRKVDDVHVKDSEARSSLMTEIANLKGLNERIGQDALNLTRALKGETKTQGNWGEVILERVLEESGLMKGREYETQVSLSDEEGRRLQPDVILRLPGGKDVIIDSKVSLLDYERYCSAADDAERAAGLKAHIASLRAHLKGLSAKSYDSLPGVRSLDFVLLFVPVEAAFITAVEHDRELFRDAFDKNIVVVCPSTLLATLRTIHNTWRTEYQNQNALKIAEEAGKLHDKFADFVKALDEVGERLGQAQKAYDTAYNRLSTGTGNLVNRVDALKKLGAKAKKSLALAEARADAETEPDLPALDPS